VYLIAKLFAVGIKNLESDSSTIIERILIRDYEATVFKSSD
jgi:hypothetical protein